MDERLEKIRRFEANVKDFDTYINDRIRDTEKENGESIDESYLNYNLKPEGLVTKECLNYIINNMYNFDLRYKLAIDKMNRLRMSLENADTEMFDELVELANEWCGENKITGDMIEKIFGI